MAHRIMIAGTQSGCGKTSVTLALLQAIQQQKISVAPYKAGPDYLDPMWHKAITGNTSYNIDTYMIGIEESKKLLQKGETKDLIFVEGMMGLFDGRQGVGEEGSSIDLAKQLDLEIWLVVDSKGMSGSIAPLVAGFVEFASKHNVTISAIIANQVGSKHHAELLATALQDFNLPPLVAWLEKDAPLLPERHLGLVMPNEPAENEKLNIPDLTDSFYFIQNDWLNNITDNPSATKWHLPLSGEVSLAHTKIAVAQDQACCFIYQANLEWLAEQGAELQFISPLAGDKIPENTDALWLPGGYPELYASQLSTSKTLSSIDEFVKQGGSVLAECGGMMLLGKSIIDHSGTEWTMAGTLPFYSKMQDRLVSLGYRDELSGAKGHEFHHSTRELIDEENQTTKAFSLKRGDEGVQFNNCRASYVHWYFPSAPKQVSKWFSGG